MWRRNRGLSVVAAVALVVLTATPSRPGNRIDPSGKTFRVIVKIDIFHDDPRDVERWKKAIDRYWNNPPGLKRRWTYCGRPVEFVPDIEVKPKGANQRKDAHRIDVKLVPPGVDFTSNVKRRGGKFNPANNSRGVWASNEDDATIAHEFGHFLGLADEYEVISEDPRRSRPLPGFEGSIMAEHDGQVNQGLIDKAMINNQADPLCEVWEGSYNMRLPAGTNLGDTRVRGSAHLEVAPDDSIVGSMSGEGVTFAYAGGPIPITHACEIGGRRETNSLVLEFLSCTTKNPARSFSSSGGSLTLAIGGTNASGSMPPLAGQTFEMTLNCVSCEEAVG